MDIVMIQIIALAMMILIIRITLMRMNMMKTWSSKALTVLRSSESCMKRVSYCSNPFVSVREGGAFTRACIASTNNNNKKSSTTTSRKLYLPYLHDG